MIASTNKYPDLIDAKWINTKTGKEENLKQKLNSKKELSNCLFIDKKIKIENNIFVKFRFDFTAITSSGDPTLDADFFDKNNNKIILNDDFKKAHHTLRELDIISNQYVYKFLLNNFLLKINLQRINNKIILGKACIIKKD